MAEMKKESLKIGGRCSWTVRDTQGNVVQTGQKTNLIMTLGLNEIVDCVGDGLSGTAFMALALGTDDGTNTDPSQTELGAEITDTGLGRAAATVTNETGGVLQFEKQWTATGAKSIEEIGIFNNATSGGVMLGRLLTGTITVADGFTITFTYQVTFS